MTERVLPWFSPLLAAQSLEMQRKDYCLLYSGVNAGYSGNTSFLAYTPVQYIKADNFTPLEQACAEYPDAYWFGYLGYGLKNATEKLSHDAPSEIPLPALWFTRYANLCIFHHDTQTVTIHGDAPPVPASVATSPLPKVAALHSDMDKATYLAHVERILSAIRRGDLYQANLTRKFFGQWEETPNPAQLFAQLCHHSPAPYAALIRHGDTAIISSSPERFMTMNAAGSITARPIKGTAPRGNTEEEDNALARALAQSEKDRAENLMIIDLIRNDLSRSCETGSVNTPALFEVTRHTTLHHLSSTITGQKRGNVSAISAIANAFPPGSMTGAPKIKAMELCSALEPRARGVYSGALGWVNYHKGFDLSVVIRTIIMQQMRFEFQVGGAIVHGSTPHGEWQETLLKAKAIASTLGLPLETLAGL